jgi:hypothetical protein
VPKYPISILPNLFKLWHLTLLDVLNICAPSTPTLCAFSNSSKIQLNCDQIGIEPTPFPLNSLPLSSFSMQTNQEERSTMFPLSAALGTVDKPPCHCPIRLDSMERRSPRPSPIYQTLPSLSPPNQPPIGDHRPSLLASSPPHPNDLAPLPLPYLSS